VNSIEAQGSSSPMKYLRRLLVRWRAGMYFSGVGSSNGGGPSPSAVTTPGISCRLAPAANASSTFCDAPSPSPRMMQSIAPSACSSISWATNEALWPPTNTRVPGSVDLTSLASSTTSGTLAR
jgi:hypothetical protein